MPKKGTKRKKNTATVTGRTSAVAVEVETNVAPKEPSSRVLYIAEIVSHIFSYLDRSDHARNVRVCKSWSAHSVRLIWREVDSLHVLASLLCPLIVVGRTTGPDKQTLYGFSQLPCLEDWKRFEKYSPFVKILSYRPSNSQSEKLLSRSVMMDISQTRPLAPILPNLHTLTWYPHRSSVESNSPTSTDAFLLMSPTVTKFHFHLHHEGVEPHIRQYLHDIPLRMPLLKDMKLDTKRPISGLEEDIVQLFSRLSSIAVLLLPTYFLSHRSLDALSTLPNLRVLDCGWTTLGNSRPDSPSIDFNPEFTKERFTALKNVALRMHLVDAAKFVNITNAVGGLFLFFNYSLGGTASDLQKLLEILASGHTELCRLNLQEAHVPTNDVTDNDFVLLQHLKPISKFSGLTKLSLGHRPALSMTVAELESVLVSVRLLQELRLNEAPFEHRTSSFSLEVIPTIAKHCRFLEQLAVFVDATQPPPSTDTILPPDVIPFPNLTSLSVGVSLITKETSQTVALYLSSLLLPKCKLEHGAWWIKAMRGATLRFPEANARLKIWEEVSGLLDLVTKVRLQDRARAWIQ